MSKDEAIKKLKNTSSLKMIQHKLKQNLNMQNVIYKKTWL